MDNFEFDKLFPGTPWLRNGTIFLTIHGSRAYGLNTENSDTDYKGIAIPPSKYFLGYLHKFDQAEAHEPDITIYNIQKFFKLASDCNPNIIELLYTDPKHHLITSTVSDGLISIRDMFLSKKARHTFSGYAFAQLKRIKTHKKWLLNPPDHKPFRQEYGLPETSLLGQDLMGAIEATVKTNDPEWDKNIALFGVGIEKFGLNVMATYQKERAYHNALTQFQQYENWKKNRNPARHEMEEKFGYDTKHAMHLVRLMRMCREILEGQGVIVNRVKDRNDLLSIRNGAWSYEFLLEWAESMDQEIARLYEISTLPHSPDREKLDQICHNLIEKNI